MSKVHYFQRFQQKENVVTNNTLLLFSRLYGSSPIRFEHFINSLLSEDGADTIDVGLSFRQQEGNGKRSSIPDGAITQKSIKVLIETKLYDNHDSSQLKRHVDGFGSEETQLLLLINPTEPSQQFNDKVIEFVNSHNEVNSTNIRYAAITFKHIVESMRSVISDYDVELNELVDDYSSFCDEAGLIPRHQFAMRAITAGISFDANVKYNIYFDPIERSFSRHQYIGLYKGKAIRAIGLLTKVVRVDFDIHTETFNSIDIRDIFNQPNKSQKLTDAEILALKSIIKVAKDKHGWDIHVDHQFFFVEQFYPTHFAKSSKYPLMHTRFFDLGEELGVEALPGCQQIASLLNGKEWE
jgi:hypothetical protein